MGARPIIREAKKLWREKKLSVAFFDYLNMTMDCGDSCPLNLGTAKYCRLAANKNKLYLQFSVAVINSSLKVIFVISNENSICKLIF